MEWSMSVRLHNCIAFSFWSDVQKDRAEERSLLGHDTVPLDELFIVFKKIIVPSTSRVNHAKKQWEQLTNDTASYPTRLECSSTLEWEPQGSYEQCQLLQSIDSIVILWYVAISGTWHKYHSLINLFPKILHVHLGKLLQILIIYVLKYIN